MIEFNVVPPNSQLVNKASEKEAVVGDLAILGHLISLHRNGKYDMVITPLLPETHAVIGKALACYGDYLKQRYYDYTAKANRDKIELRDKIDELQDEINRMKASASRRNRAQEVKETSTQVLKEDVKE